MARNTKLMTLTCQVPLSTTRQVIDIGPNRSIVRIIVANNDGSNAVDLTVYMIPLNRSSSTKSEHVFWTSPIAAKSTDSLDFSEAPLIVPNGWTLEAKASTNSDLTLNLFGL
jgi:hypothetical protein